MRSGPFTLSLWLACSASGPFPGMSATEFDRQTPPGAVIFGFATYDGFLNGSDDTHLLLVVGGYPAEPVVAGSWHVLGSIQGSYCLVRWGGVKTLYR